MGVLVVNQPIDGGLQVGFHILLLLILEFKHKIGIGVVVFDVQLHLLEDLAFDVLSDLLLLVTSCLQSLVQCLVLAAHQHDKVEVILREDICAVEIEQQPSSSHIVICSNKVDQLFVTELRDVELLIPFIIELIVDDDFADWKVFEVEGLVEQLAEGGLAGTWCASDQDVGGLALHCLLLNHCCRDYMPQQMTQRSQGTLLHQCTDLSVALTLEVYQSVDFGSDFGSAASEAFNQTGLFSLDALGEQGFFLDAQLLLQNLLIELSSFPEFALVDDNVALQQTYLLSQQQLLPIVSCQLTPQLIHFLCQLQVLVDLEFVRVNQSEVVLHYLVVQPVLVLGVVVGNHGAQLDQLFLDCGELQRTPFRTQCLQHSSQQLLLPLGLICPPLIVSQVIIEGVQQRIFFVQVGTQPPEHLHL